jgi:hypothetical protein
LIAAVSTTILKIIDHLSETEKSNLKKSIHKVTQILTPEIGIIGLTNFRLGMIQQHFQRETFSILERHLEIL